MRRILALVLVVVLLVGLAQSSRQASVSAQECDETIVSVWGQASQQQEGHPVTAVLVAGGGTIWQLKTVRVVYDVRLNRELFLVAFQVDPTLSGKIYVAVSWQGGEKSEGAWFSLSDSCTTSVRFDIAGQ